MKNALNRLIKRIESKDELLSTLFGLVIVAVVLGGITYGVFGDSLQTGWWQPKVEILENAQESPYQEYLVKQGEGLSQIAKKFYGDDQLWQEIAKVNNIQNPNIIEVGRLLLIPKLDNPTPSPIPVEETSTPKTYVVKKGDYLSRISSIVYGTTEMWDEILEANKEIKDPSVLEAGMVLVMPE